MKKFYQHCSKKLMFFLLMSFGFAQLYAQETQFPPIKEDRIGRIEHEERMLRNPFTKTIPEDIVQKELLYVLSSKAELQPAFKGNKYASRNDEWAKRGPWNLGGRTRALAIDKTNDTLLLAGGVSGGMWRSTNGGKTWVKTTNPTQIHSVTCIAQDTRTGQTQTWYYGTGELSGNSASETGAPYRGNGIFKSTDRGVTWTQLTATAATTPATFNNNFQYVWNIVVNPTNGDVYAATYGAIYRSTDGGTTWTKVLDGNTANYTDIAVTSKGVLYATISSTNATNKGIWRSTDGTTWVNINPTFLPSLYNRITLAVAPSNENVVYFFAATPGSGVGEDFNNRHSFFKYTFVSGDGSGTGGRWENRTNNLAAFGGSVGDLNQANYNQFVKVKPDNENVVFIGSTNLYRSTDGFATTTNTSWIGGYSTRNNVSSYKNHHPDQHSLVFLPSNPKIMISGHDGGLSKTTDNLATNAGGRDGDAILPVAWESLNNGYFTTQAYAIAIDPLKSGDSRIVAGFQDNGKWYVDGNTPTVFWREEVGGGDGAYVAIVSEKDIRYISTQNGAVARVEGSNIENPTSANHVHPAGATGQLFINPFILDKNDQKIMYYPAGAFLWRNNNVEAINTGWNFDGTNASSWTRLSNTQIPSGTISALDVSKSPANVLYYGTSEGKVYKLSNAQATNPTVADVSSPDFPTGAYINCITVDNNDANKVLVVFTNYGVKSIWYSENGGTSWTDISGNLEEKPDGTGNGPSVRWISIAAPADKSKTYYVGTSTGVYSTTKIDGTATSWTQEGTTTIGNVVVTMIVTRDSDGLVVVATHANGMFSKGGILITELSENQAFNTDVIAYPNPTTDKVTLKIEDSKVLTAKAEVYDLQGNLLVEQLLYPYNSNQLETTLDLSNFAKGVYVVRVITGNFVKEMKVVLE